MNLRAIRSQPEVLLLMAIAAVWLAFRFYTGIVLEDALITWHYAANLATGNGFVFNPGERVLGTTTPLLALLLAGFGVVFGPDSIPVAGVGLMVVCGIAAGLMLRRILLDCRVPRSAAFLAAALCLLHADVVWSAVGGMETMLVLVLMMASLLLSLRGAVSGAFLACVALVLTRPDGGVWALLIGLHALQRHGLKRVVRACLLPLLVLGVWVAFAVPYFGSPVPHSLLAKAALTGDKEILGASALQRCVRWFFSKIGVGTAQGFPGRVALGAWIVALLALPLALLRNRRLWQAWPLFLFPPVFACVYLLGQAPHFRWYLVPFTWCCVASGALGLHYVLVRLASRGDSRTETWASRGLQAAVALLLAAAFLNGIRREARWHRLFQENEQATRRAAGEWLRRETPTHASVAMEAIGYQGTYAQRKIIDLAGLISPEVLRLRKESPTNAVAFRRILHELRPDYLVLRTSEVRENHHFHGGRLWETDADAAWFASHYRPVCSFLAPHVKLWGANAEITIFEARDAAPKRTALGRARLPARSGAG